MATAAFSKTTLGAWLALSHPARIHSRYLPTRMTPCESWPTRFDSTSRRAIVAASFAAQPAPRMIAGTNAVWWGAATVLKVGAMQALRRSLMNLGLRSRLGPFQKIE